MKESNTVDVADSAQAKGIDDEPVFAWWVTYKLRKYDVIISSIKSRVIKTTHNYGIKILTSIYHAYEIDKNNKDTFWR